MGTYPELRNGVMTRRVRREETAVKQLGGEVSTGLP